MRQYWLMDQHGGEGPTALVETDGSLHVVDVIRFGPDVTELDDQQRVWDQVMGKVGPTLKPFVDAASVEEEGVAPHSKLQRGGHDGPGPSQRGRGGSAGGGGRASSGPSRKGSRGDR